MAVFSRHAEEVLRRRGIEKSWVEAVLAMPDWTAADPDPTLTRAFGAVAAFDHRILRVVFRPDGTDHFVVTAHWDRGARR